jgi:hypothetical protein
MKLGPSSPPDFEVDIVCACVDGLPPSLDWIETRKARYPREGLAFLHGRADQIVPELWETETETPKNSATESSSITFSTYQEPLARMPLAEVTLPLANTLFVNGRNSTVSVSKWRFKGGEEKYEKVKTTEKSHQVVNVFGGRTRGFPPGIIPLIPLTPARRIVSGLGNIIRQLSFGEGDVGPGSRELEQSINDYMSMVGIKDSRVDVWALVTPSESMPSPPPVSFKSWTDPDAIRRYWRQGGPDSRFIGHWLYRGATLCSICTSLIPSPFGSHTLICIS